MIVKIVVFEKCIIINKSIDCIKMKMNLIIFPVYFHVNACFSLSVALQTN